MGVMAVMNPSQGDLKVVWDEGNSAEVEAARAQFDNLRKQGYLAYTVRPGGERGSQIRDFDPSAESIILAPPLRGG